MKRHYHFLYGMRGYIPDHNEVFTARRDAERHAAEFIRETRWQLQERWIGSAKSGWYECIEENSLWYAEITECTEPDCLALDL